MNAPNPSFQDAVQRYSRDETFRAECLSDGRAFLRAADAEPAESVNVETHINDGKTFHFVIPTRTPSFGDRELLDSEFEAIVGGGASISNSLVTDQSAVDYVSSFAITANNLNYRFTTLKV